METDRQFNDKKICIIGGGNIGMSIAFGLKESGLIDAGQICITRKEGDLPKDLNENGFVFTSDNSAAVKDADIVFLAVLPIMMGEIIDQIKADINPNQILISIATGITIDDIAERVGENVPIFRAMPNTAIQIKESMTCIAANTAGKKHIDMIEALFNSVGITLVIEEKYITSATALGSCGIAFFLRSIRAAAQGGIQIGFHADEAQLIAAQTAKGAAELILRNGSHPEDEIDKVTTPRGVTIAGLNEMEHNGFSSAMIKGIVRAYEKSQK